MFNVNVKCLAECKTKQGNVMVTRCRHNKGKAALATFDKLSLQHHPAVQSGMTGRALFELQLSFHSTRYLTITFLYMYNIHIYIPYFLFDFVTLS